MNQIRFEYQLLSNSGVSLNSDLKSIKLACLKRFLAKWTLNYGIILSLPNLTSIKSLRATKRLVICCSRFQWIFVSCESSSIRVRLFEN